MPRQTKQNEIDQLRRDLAAQRRLIGDLKAALSRTYRVLSKLTPDVLEARKLCMDTSPSLAWKVEVWDRRGVGRSSLIGRQLFYTRAAAEDYAEANDDNGSHVGVARSGDTEFA